MDGRPTGTLAPRFGARGPEGGSPVTGSAVWPPPPPPPSSAPSSLVQPPSWPQADDTSTAVLPSLRSPVGGRILRLFDHLTTLAASVATGGLGSPEPLLSVVGGAGGGGEEWRGAVPASSVDEAEITSDAMDRCKHERRSLDAAATRG
jgi:hypothetical protein